MEPETEMVEEATPQEQSDGAGSHTNKSSSERKRYREILEEFRIMMPGVQVLLGFLLTAPFSARFDRVDLIGRTLHGVAVLSSATATILLLAPASHHRVSRLLRGQSTNRRKRIRYSERIAVVGLGFLLVSVITSVLLVIRFVFNMSLGMVAAGFITSLGIGTWYAVPLWHRGSS